MRGMTLTPAEEEVDVDVRWEDQQKICEFARYNRMKSEYEEDMKTLEVLFLKCTFLSPIPETGCTGEAPRPGGCRAGCGGSVFGGRHR